MCLILTQMTGVSLVSVVIFDLLDEFLYDISPESLSAMDQFHG